MTDAVLDKLGLCYVSGCWAYFTTQDIEKQWGDDWNDAPYEHNAGEPYEPHREVGEDWHLIRIAFDGPFATPRDYCGLNSPYSVEQINKRCIPWLRRDTYDDRHNIPVAWAGDDLATVIDAIEAAGGAVWLRHASGVAGAGAVQ